MDTEKTLSIGEVAKLTGITVHTLRIWEHRYGFSSHMAKPPGKHRRYYPEEIKRLKLIKQGLDIGLKPVDIVNLEINTLSHEVESYGARKGYPIAVHPLQVIEKWIELVRAHDENSLLKEFQLEWEALGPVGFVEDRCSHFAKEIGDLWEIGALDVRHEHFGASLLKDFLSQHWRKISQDLVPDSNAAPFVLATFPGEAHTLGLEMVATVLAAAHKRAIYLGRSTPIEDIVKSAVETGAYGVAISICDRGHSMNSLELFAQLREKLPSSTVIIAGGCSAPSGIEYVNTFSNLRSFYDWLRIQDMP